MATTPNDLQKTTNVNPNDPTNNNSTITVPITTSGNPMENVGGLFDELESNPSTTTTTTTVTHPSSSVPLSTLEENEGDNENDSEGGASEGEDESATLETFFNSSSSTSSVPHLNPSPLNPSPSTASVTTTSSTVTSEPSSTTTPTVVLPPNSLNPSVPDLIPSSSTASVTTTSSTATSGSSSTTTPTVTLLPNPSNPSETPKEEKKKKGLGFNFSFPNIFGSFNKTSAPDPETLKSAVKISIPSAQSSLVVNSPNSTIPVEKTNKSSSLRDSTDSQGSSPEVIIAVEPSSEKEEKKEIVETKESKEPSMEVKGFISNFNLIKLNYCLNEEQKAPDDLAAQATGYKQLLDSTSEEIEKIRVEIIHAIIRKSFYEYKETTLNKKDDKYLSKENIKLKSDEETYKKYINLKGEREKLFETINIYLKELSLPPLKKSGSNQQDELNQQTVKLISEMSNKASQSFDVELKEISKKHKQTQKSLEKLKESLKDEKANLSKLNQKKMLFNLTRSLIASYNDNFLSESTTHTKLVSLAEFNDVSKLFTSLRSMEDSKEKDVSLGVAVQTQKEFFAKYIAYAFCDSVHWEQRLSLRRDQLIINALIQTINKALSPQDARTITEPNIIKIVQTFLKDESNQELSPVYKKRIEEVIRKHTGWGSKPKTTPGADLLSVLSEGENSIQTNITRELDQESMKYTRDFDQAYQFILELMEQFDAFNYVMAEKQSTASESNNNSKEEIADTDEAKTFLFRPSEKTSLFSQSLIGEIKSTFDVLLQQQQQIAKAADPVALKDPILQKEEDSTVKQQLFRGFHDFMFGENLFKVRNEKGENIFHYLLKNESAFAKEMIFYFFSEYVKQNDPTKYDLKRLQEVFGLLGEISTGGEQVNALELLLANWDKEKHKAFYEKFYAGARVLYQAFEKNSKELAPKKALKKDNLNTMLQTIDGAFASPEPITSQHEIYLHIIDDKNASLKTPFSKSGGISTILKEVVKHARTSLVGSFVKNASGETHQKAANGLQIWIDLLGRDVYPSPGSKEEDEIWKLAINRDLCLPDIKKGPQPFEFLTSYSSEEKILYFILLIHHDEKCMFEIAKNLRSEQPTSFKEFVARRAQAISELKALINGNEIYKDKSLPEFEVLSKFVQKKEKVLVDEDGNNLLHHITMSTHLLHAKKGMTTLWLDQYPHDLYQPNCAGLNPITLANGRAEAKKDNDSKDFVEFLEKKITVRAANQKVLHRPQTMRRKIVWRNTEENGPNHDSFSIGVSSLSGPKLIIPDSSSTSMESRDSRFSDSMELPSEKTSTTFTSKTQKGISSLEIKVLNINEPLEDGRTYFQNLISSQDLETIQYYLDKNVANPFMLNKFGENAFTLAADTENAGILNALLQYRDKKIKEELGKQEQANPEKLATYMLLGLTTKEYQKRLQILEIKGDYSLLGEDQYATDKKVRLKQKIDGIQQEQLGKMKLALDRKFTVLDFSGKPFSKPEEIINLVQLQKLLTVSEEISNSGLIEEFHFEGINRGQKDFNGPDVRQSESNSAPKFYDLILDMGHKFENIRFYVSNNFIPLLTDKEPSKKQSQLIEEKRLILGVNYSYHTDIELGRSEIRTSTEQPTQLELWDWREEDSDEPLVEPVTFKFFELFNEGKKEENQIQLPSASSIVLSPLNKDKRIENIHKQTRKEIADRVKSLMMLFAQKGIIPKNFQLEKLQELYKGLCYFFAQQKNEYFKKAFPMEADNLLALKSFFGIEKAFSASWEPYFTAMDSSGFHRFNSAYLSKNLGSFLQQDPFKFDMGLNEAREGKGKGIVANELMHMDGVITTICSEFVATWKSKSEEIFKEGYFALKKNMKALDSFSLEQAKGKTPQKRNMKSSNLFLVPDTTDEVVDFESTSSSSSHGSRKSSGKVEKSAEEIQLDKLLESVNEDFRGDIKNIFSQLMNKNTSPLKKPKLLKDLKEWLEIAECNEPVKGNILKLAEEINEKFVKTSSVNSMFAVKEVQSATAPASVNNNASTTPVDDQSTTTTTTTALNPGSSSNTQQ